MEVPSAKKFDMMDASLQARVGLTFLFRDMIRLGDLIVTTVDIVTDTS